MSCENCEELRLRAESAEARIASVSGVTREELARAAFEMGAQGARVPLVAALDEAISALRRVGCQDVGSCYTVHQHPNGPCFVCTAIAKAEGKS